jgi:hypothetical protein
MLVDANLQHRRPAAARPVNGTDVAALPAVGWASAALDVRAGIRDGHDMFDRMLQLLADRRRRRRTAASNGQQPTQGDHAREPAHRSSIARGVAPMCRCACGSASRRGVSHLCEELPRTHNVRTNDCRHAR